jgi:hypothetical protein
LVAGPNCRPPPSRRAMIWSLTPPRISSSWTHGPQVDQSRNRWVYCPLITPGRSASGSRRYTWTSHAATRQLPRATHRAGFNNGVADRLLASAAVLPRASFVTFTIVCRTPLAFADAEANLVEVRAKSLAAGAFLRSAPSNSEELRHIIMSF